VEVADIAEVVGIAVLDAVELAAVSLHTLALLLRPAAARRICCAGVRPSEAEAADFVVWDP
jgi:hypothetical protein